jgi:serine/threonine protein kinase
MNKEEIYKKGDVIGGRFEVRNTLGEGGCGVVYLVYDRELKALIALKTFRNELLANPNARNAFKKECLLWVNLEEHPHILAARWVSEVSGRLFVSMDYISPDALGRVNLHHHLAAANAPVDTNLVLGWAIQFCLGMEHAQERGLEYHRDTDTAQPKGRSLSVESRRFKDTVRLGRKRSR